MKAMKWLVAVLMGAMLAVSPALAAEGKADNAKPAKEAKAKDAKAKEPKSSLKGEYSIMAAELKLDDAQKAKLEEAVKANDAAEKAWLDTDNGKKSKTLKDDLAKAKEAKDEAKIKSLGEEAKAISAEQAKMKEEGKAKVMAVLTDDQKAQWAGFSLYRATIGKFKALNLTDEQTKQIRQMADKAAAVKQPEPEKGKKPAAPTAALSKEIEEKVLTDAQKAELAKAHEAKKPGEDKKAPKDGDPKAGKNGGTAPVVE